MISAGTMGRKKRKNVGIGGGGGGGGGISYSRHKQKVNSSWPLPVNRTGINYGQAQAQEVHGLFLHRYKKTNS